MKFRTPAASAVALFVLVIVGPAAPAAVVTIGAAKDNTLFEDATGSVSDGSGPHLYVGRTGLAASGATRRGLIAFDLTALPAGATISSALFSVNVSRKAPGAAPETITLHRMTRNWGAGASDSGSPGGFGAPAAIGDATWTTPSFGAAIPTTWTTAGGDFVALAGGAIVVDDAGKYTFPLLPGLVADLQAWHGDPSTNFGWMMKGDEFQQSTARRIDSANHFTPSFRPSLTITYEVPEPGAMLLAAAAIVPLLTRRRRILPSA